MHSKHKGILAESKVMADLYDKELFVAITMDDLLPFDLICIDKKYNLYKIQVKYCRLVNGTINLSVRNSMSNKTLKYTKKYNTDEVDVFAIYCPDIDECLYVKSNILNHINSSFKIRVGRTLNNNSKLVNFKEHFVEFPC